MRDRSGILEIKAWTTSYGRICYHRIVWKDKYKPGAPVSQKYKYNITPCSYQRLSDFVQAHLDEFKFRPYWSLEMVGWVGEERI